MSALLFLRVGPEPTDAALLTAAAHAVQHRLYVALDGDWQSHSLEFLQRRLQQIYEQAAAASDTVDTRVLLPNAGATLPGGICAAPADCDCVLWPSGHPASVAAARRVLSASRHLQPRELTWAAASGAAAPAEASTTRGFTTYESCCLGGNGTAPARKSSKPERPTPCHCCGSLRGSGDRRLSRLARTSAGRAIASRR